MKRVEQQHFETKKTARVYHLKPSGEPKAICFAIHGYRQLPEYFIRTFGALADAGIEVIAPEGLSRFYIEGYNGRVGASWMTKEDRETDIADYLFYLNALLKKVRQNHPGLPIHLLGFSQGGATASRWFSSTDFSWKSFTLYASVFPNDFDFEAQADRFSSIPCFLLFGDKDQFADEITIMTKTEWLQAKGVFPELIRFTGGHDIYPDTLKFLANKMLM
jgi:predicted esterase